MRYAAPFLAAHPLRVQGGLVDAAVHNAPIRISGVATSSRILAPAWRGVLHYFRQSTPLLAPQ